MLVPSITDHPTFPYQWCFHHRLCCWALWSGVHWRPTFSSRYQFYEVNPEPTVKAFIDHYFRIWFLPSVRSCENLAKQNNFQVRIVIANWRDWLSGSLIADMSCSYHIDCHTLILFESFNSQRFHMVHVFFKVFIAVQLWFQFIKNLLLYRCKNPLTINKLWCKILNHEKTFKFNSNYFCYTYQVLWILKMWNPQIFPSTGAQILVSWFYITFSRNKMGWLHSSCLIDISRKTMNWNFVIKI